MIGFLRGEVCEVSEDTVVLDVGGVGYNVMITSKEADLLPSVGQEVRVYTYLSVREDAMKLYGFLTREDLSFFKLLIGVNGIGPKGAQGILAVMDPDELRFAILSGDAKTISKCPGIGAKTAQRIILDLKDKVDVEAALNASVGRSVAPASAGKGSDESSEAIEALVALGFSATDAMRAVRKIDGAAEMDVEDLIMAALKVISAF